MQKFLRVALVPTDLTHVMCIACGRFRCEFAIVVQDDGEQHAGLHKRCLKNVKAKRGTA